MSEYKIIDAPLELIDPFVNQGRERFDEAELKALADNIKANGLLQHGVAWFDTGRGRYVLLCGERRLRASRLAGLPTMAVKVLRGSMTPGQMLAINPAENIQRSSLNPIERWKGFRRLMQLESLTASEVASRMSVSNATVSNSLSLLELPEAMQARVATGELPASVAANIARLLDDDDQRVIADHYASGTLNRDGVAAEVKRLLGERKQTRPKAARHLFRLGVVAITVTAGRKPLSLDMLLPALRQLGEAAEGVKQKGGTIASLAASLKAS